MKLNRFYSGLLLSCALTLSLSACSDDDNTPDTDPVTDPNSAIELSMADKGFALDANTKFIPGFKTGDKAGLFVVEAGQIVASNIELTFDGNSWKSTVSVSPSADKYFVYTPYVADAQSKVNTTATTARDFFAPFIAQCAAPALQQTSYEESVRPFDFTYADASIESTGGTINLSADANHILAVTSWSLPGKTNYVTSGGFAYSTPGGAEAGNVTLGSETVTPCNINGDPALFHLPAQNSTLSVAYNYNNQDKTIDVTLNSAAGSISMQKIEGGSDFGGERDITIGDIYYCNGAIIPVESLDALTQIPAGVAGVVFCVDPARFSTEETELLGEVHALVISAKMATFKNRTYFVWNDAYPAAGDDGAGRFFDNIEDSNFPGLFLPLIEDRENTANSYEINNADISGYKYNQIIRARRSEEISKNYYPVFTAIDNLNSAVAITAKTTGWYLPSVGHILDFMRNIGKANATAENATHYTSSTEVSDFIFEGTESATIRTNLDAAMEKINDDEKDTFADGRNALWTSSYASIFRTTTEEFVSGAREVVFDAIPLLVMSYDVIGKGNVRGILAF